MRSNIVIKKTEAFLKAKLSGEGTGHDFWHSMRVARVAAYIGRKEKADLFVVRLAALLHDIADWKFHGGDTHKGPRIAERFLKSLGVPEDIRASVSCIIENVSFKGAGVADKVMPLEGCIVQDADRLDALGAIGIARTFAYGGSRGQEIYNPGIKPIKHGTFASYKKSASPSLNHFYEKLLLLKGRMNTRTGRALALERHQYMVKFLKQFYREWDFPGKS